jgi:ABC-type multidrug transport system ATPase subunit
VRRESLIHSDAAIEVKELGKDFGNNQAVKSVSFTVNKGEIFGFFGPNGAGKTTTIRLLCGLSKPSRGYATICGHNILNDPTGIRKNLSITLEENVFYEKMKVNSYLNFFAELTGIISKERPDKLRRVIDTCELSNIINKQICALSHGQRQRISLARAFLSDAPMMFLDEPFQGIDIVQRKKLRNHLREYAKKGNTVFFTSHDIVEAELIVDRYAFIDHGSILKIGAAKELRDQFLSPRYLLRVSNARKTQQILSSSLRLTECTINGDEVTIGLENKNDVAKIVALLVASDIALLEMKLLGTMEDVFLRIRQCKGEGA